MPFWGLVLSSAAFWVPSVVGKRRRKRGFAAACRALTCTSLMFHSQICLPLSFYIDRAYVHAFAAWYGCKSAARALTTRSRAHLAWCASVAAPLGIYQFKVRRTDGLASQLWHVAFHLTGQVCLVAYAVVF
jgi:hypothetical protein